MEWSGTWWQEEIRLLQKQQLYILMPKVEAWRWSVRRERHTVRDIDGKKNADNLKVWLRLRLERSLKRRHEWQKVGGRDTEKYRKLEKIQIERDNETGGGRETRERVSVCVCVCERERERVRMQGAPNKVLRHSLENNKCVTEFFFKRKNDSWSRSSMKRPNWDEKRWRVKSKNNPKKFESSRSCLEGKVIQRRN